VVLPRLVCCAYLRPPPAGLPRLAKLDPAGTAESDPVEVGEVTMLLEAIANILLMLASNKASFIVKVQGEIGRL
jgi:hypothetical protein